MDNGSWVTVNRKITRVQKEQRENKVVQKEKKIFQHVEDNTSKESKEEDEALKEERKRKNILKKQRIKEEKKYKREQLARELRESKRRDTKVTVVSQAVIDYNSKNVRNQQSSKIAVNETSHNTYNPLNNYTSDYPTLQAFNSYEKNKPRTRKWEENVAFNKENNSSVNEGKDSTYISLSSVKTSTPPQKFNSSTKNWPNPAFQNLTDKNVPEILPTKRKVKTKDLINLEIMDLIELKKKSEKPKAKAHHQPAPAPPERIERRGKVSEGKKKLTTLKKNQLRQKTDLMTVLSDISLKKENLIKVDENLKEKNDETPSETKARNKSPDLPSNKEQSPSNINGENKTSKEPSVIHDKELDKTKARQELVSDLRSLMNPIHTRKFREYCTHLLSPEIDQALRELIELVVMFHQRLYHQDPTKAKMRRRFYCGLKEALKHMNKLTCIVMAPNLKPSPGKGCLDELVNKVLHSALEHGVPVLFGLTDRVLGRLAHRKVPASCISLVNIQGAQDKYERAKEHMTKATEQYEELVKKHEGKKLLGGETSKNDFSEE